MEADPDNFLFVRPLFYRVYVASHRPYTFNPQHPLWGVDEYLLEQLSMSEDFMKRHSFEV